MAKEQNNDWISIFDGKTLNGWGATGNDEGWAVDDGSILCTVKGGNMLYSEEQYDNFILSLEYMSEPNVNSGVFIRWADLQRPVQTGIEIQILDTHGKEPATKHCCGAFYDAKEPTRNVCKPAGEWNEMIITCDDSILVIEMNGEEIVRADLDDWDTPHQNPDGSRNKFGTALKDFPRKGHIGLQDHGGKLWFRNIKIKSL
ncbi:MAG: DUF1080 domain-containing protein [Candidatus Poribacteria bacterium]|nr:DUF1080 domain-containing protein [Candidatus Poribacteria bacterium]